MVGDGQVEIKKIAIALDPSLSAVKEAKKRGCNLLVTHHPAYLGMIEDVDANNIMFSAPNYGVALMNFHTALDVSAEGASTLANLLDLKVKKVLCPTGKDIGFGRICAPNKGLSISLGSLEKKCVQAFGRKPRVWGKASSKLKKIAINTGSVGRLDDEPSILQPVIDKKCDCIVCGEIKYHDAIEIAERGICIVELGHDVSELPLVDIIYDAILDCGFTKSEVVKINQNDY